MDILFVVLFLLGIAAFTYLVLSMFSLFTKENQSKSEREFLKMIEELIEFHSSRKEGR